MEGPLPENGEAQRPESAGKRGGWFTFPFMAGTMAGLNLAGVGWMANLIVYLIGKFNMKSIDAAQVSNLVNGCTSLFPIIGAIIADSFLGCFSVIYVSSLISSLGIFLLGLTATLKSLTPQPCEIRSSLCESPSRFQFAVLYTGIALASIGLGGIRFTLATMGADQFDQPGDQVTFFNWYIFTMNISSVISYTAIVYVEDSVSWSWGFGLSLAANVIGLAIFLSGRRFYRRVQAKGSPFSSLARVIVASFRKRKVPLSSRSEDYHYCNANANGDTKSSRSEDYHYCNANANGDTKMVAAVPTKRFRFLNRAALTTEGDIQSNTSTAKSWRLCTVQQVEDFKALITIFPLWSSSIFLGTPIGIQASLTVLQALSMESHVGPHFKIPPGSILVTVLISAAVLITTIDRFLLPTWRKLTGRNPTPLQRVGVGHVLNVLGMAVSALIEAKRLKIAVGQSHRRRALPGSAIPMSVLWLFPQLIMVGIGEAFHFPGQVALYYQEFPPSLKSTATAVVGLIIGVSFYLSMALIDLVRRVTGWLPENINDGRVDNVYWMLVVVGVLNFGYYLVCARFYRYQNVV